MELDYRVYHEQLVNQEACIGLRTVTFDEWGISPELSPEEYERLLTIPGFIGLGDLAVPEEMSGSHSCSCDPDELGDGEALPEEGEAPSPEEIDSLQELMEQRKAAGTLDSHAALDAYYEAQDEEEEVPEHEADDSLFGQFQAAPDRIGFYSGLPLVQRLDLVSDPRLAEEDAAEMFVWETAGKKSKRVVNALDRRLVTLRKSKSADSVTRGMLAVAYPRAEEQ